LPSFTFALSLLLSEPLSVLTMAIGAVFFHEFGHFLFFMLFTRTPPVFSIDRFGFRLSPCAPLLPHEEFWICLGGPFINILFGILFCRFFGAFGFLFGCMHFLLAFFNLLPFRSSDGGRIIALLLARFLPKEKAKRAVSFLSASVLAFFFFLSLYTFYLTGNGLCGVFFAVFSFPWKDLDRPNDFGDFGRKKEISGEKKS